MLVGEAPGGPVGVLARGRLQGVDDDGLNRGVADLALGPRTRSIAETLQTIFREAVPPFRHRRGMHALASSNLSVRTAFGTTKHDPRPERQRLGRRVPTNPSLQRLAFGLAQFDARGGSSSSRHSAPQMLAHIGENAPAETEIPRFHTFRGFSAGRDISGGRTGPPPGPLPARPRARSGCRAGRAVPRAGCPSSLTATTRAHPLMSR